MAGKTGMPGHNISSPKDGPVSQIFQNGTGNLC